MGAYAAVLARDQWRRDFGVDIEHIDQRRVTGAGEWLEMHCGQAASDGKALTPEKLERQIGSHHAVRDLNNEWDLDFVRIKGQPELTNSFYTMDPTEAILNDPNVWEGPHEPIACATEADSDGTLTTELFKDLEGTPMLFAAHRHNEAEGDFWDFVDSDQPTTYLVGHSYDPSENLPKVRLLPELSHFQAGCASVQSIAAPGEVKQARMTPRSVTYSMGIAPGEFLELPPSNARATTWESPHTFARLRVPPERFITTSSFNHIRDVYGGYMEELTTVGKMLSIEAEIYA